MTWSYDDGPYGDMPYGGARKSPKTPMDHMTDKPLKNFILRLEEEMGMYILTPYPAVATSPPVRGPIPDDLGLALIRGPTEYVFMEPVDAPASRAFPVIAMLGDWHEDDWCAKTCADETRCVSAQDRTHNTFVQHLDTVYGAYKPDLFVEDWSSKEARAGEGKRRDDAGFLGATCPMAMYIRNVRPCTFRDKKAIVGGQAVPCLYKNVRVHVADARSNYSYKFNDYDASLRRALWDRKNTTAGSFIAACRSGRPEFTAEQVVQTIVNMNADKFFVDPMCLAYSRVSHELMRLPADIRTRLRDAVRKNVTARYKGMPPLFDASIMGQIRAWLAGPLEARLPHEIANIFEFFWIRWGALPVNCLALDLYAIARALKVTADGKRSELAVMHFGRDHLQSIATILATAGLYTLKKLVMNKYRAKDFRCVVLSTPGPKLIPATDMATVQTYTGPVLAGRVDTHLYVDPRADWSTTPRLPLAAHSANKRPPPPPTQPPSYSRPSKSRTTPSKPKPKPKTPKTKTKSPKPKTKSPKPKPKPKTPKPKPKTKTPKPKAKTKTPKPKAKTPKAKTPKPKTKTSARKKASRK